MTVLTATKLTWNLDTHFSACMSNEEEQRLVKIIYFISTDAPCYLCSLLTIPSDKSPMLWTARCSRHHGVGFGDTVKPLDNPF